MYLICLESFFPRNTTALYTDANIAGQGRTSQYNTSSYSVGLAITSSVSSNRGIYGNKFGIYQTTDYPIYKASEYDLTKYNFKIYSTSLQRYLVNGTDYNLKITINTSYPNGLWEYTIPETSELYQSNSTTLAKGGNLRIESLEESETFINIQTSGSTHFSINPSSVANGKETIITVKSDDNYSFKNAPTISYSGTDSINGSFTKVSDSEYTFTFNQTLSDTSGVITITAETNLTIQYDISVVGNASVNPTKVSNNATNTITITANNGYEITETPTISISTSETLDYTWTKISNEQYQVTFYSNLDSDSANFIFTVLTKEKDVEITVNKNGDNFSVNPSSVVNGSETVITVTTDNNYAFSSVPTISYSGTDSINGSFTKVSDSEYTFTFNQTLSDTSGVITITAKTYQVTYINITTSDDTFYVNPTRVINGSSTTVRILANEYYTFNDIPTISYSGTDSINGSFTKVSDSEYTFTFNQTLSDTSGVITITAETTYNYIYTGIVEKYGVINGYKVTYDDMKKLSPLLYIAVGTTSGQNITDRTPFILKYSHLIFDCPIANNKGTIKLANYDSQIDADLILSDLITADFGTIEIKGKYNNNLDYLYSDIQASLCGIGIVKLDASKIINHKIKISATLNLLTLKSTFHIINSDNENDEYDLYIFNGYIGYDIPYNVAFDRVANANLQNDIILSHNEILVFYKNIANENETIFSTDKTDLISNEKGFFQCDEIYFETFSKNILQTEIEQIKKLLQAGVYK